MYFVIDGIHSGVEGFQQISLRSGITRLVVSQGFSGNRHRVNIFTENTDGILSAFIGSAEVVEEKQQKDISTTRYNYYRLGQTFIGVKLSPRNIRTTIIFSRVTLFPVDHDRS